MDPLAIVPGDADDEGYALSDRPHIEIMFDALDDTVGGVTGAEGFGLTEAQRYAEGVLIANGTLSARAVDGNESFFTTVSSGAKSVYDYIVKMFKGLWGFFFNRDAPKLVEEAKKEVTEFKNELEQFGKGSEEETADYIGTVRNIIKSRDDAKAKELLDQIDRAKTLADQKGVVLMLGHELPKFNKDGQAAFTKAVARIIEKMNKLLAYHEDAKKKSMVGGKEHNLAWDMFTKMTPIIDASKKFVTQLEDIKELTDLNKAKSVAQAMINDLDEAKKAIATVNSQKGEISKEITKCEGLLKESNNENTEAKQLLGQLRVILAYFSGFAHHIKTSVEDLLTLKKATKRVFCL